MATKNQSPKQEVEARFGTRGDLVDTVVGLLDGDDDTRGRLMGTTNKKLLRIHAVATQVKSDFGSKGALIDSCGKLQFGSTRPNAGWREKMETWTVKRLLDHHRQLSTRA